MSYYASAQLPDRRVFWAVWPTWEALKCSTRRENPEPAASATGYAGSKTEATTAARAAGGRRAQDPWHARDYHEKHIKISGNALYSVASVGSRGWRWLVWESETFWIDPARVLGTGTELTREAAEQAAHAAGGQQSAAPSFAAEWHRQEARRQRAQRRSSTTGSTPVEYIYLRHECSSCGEWQTPPGWRCEREPTPYRIIRKSKTRIFIDTLPASFERHPDYLDDVKTFTLDRAALERGEIVHRSGIAWGWAWALSPDAFTPDPARSSKAPACIAALGLTWPSTQDEVRRAYRRLALERHPDAGGDHASFVQLGRHYQAALGLVGVAS